MPPKHVLKRSTTDDSIKLNAGPYVAKIVSHLDPTYSGRLTVVIQGDVTSGENSENPIAGREIQVSYCMPFYGVNSVNTNDSNDVYASSQQSYGFWAVPPDPGTKVLVIFAEGQINQGYWIGCIQDEYMNFMVPDGRPATNFIVQDKLPTDFKGKPLPSAEYNKAIKRTSSDPQAFLKPYNSLFTNVLAKQGLIDDVTRGLTSSSAKRNTPNTVFGMNTPGPLDKRDNAPKGKYGNDRDGVFQFRSRLGGSGFVMDDGDPRFIRKGLAKETPPEYVALEADPTNKTGNHTLPYNDLVRLRTRTGHQILMHNTEDLIYIGNANGSAWIELTANGKIDIYSDDSISVRSGNDINFTADRDINFSAGRDVHWNSGRDTNITANDNMNTKVGIDMKTFAGANKDVWVGDNHTIAVGSDQNIQIKGADSKTVTGNSSLQIAGSKSTAVEGQDTSKVGGSLRHAIGGTYNINSTGSVHLQTAGMTNIVSGVQHRETAPQIHMNSAGAVASPADTVTDDFISTDTTSEVTSIAGGLDVPLTQDASRAAEAEFANHPVRVPEREPWGGHEHLNPLGHTPNATVSIQSPPPAQRQSNTLINSDDDAQQTTEISGPNQANIGTIRRPNGEVVSAPQTVVPGKDEPIGKQPAEPVPVNDMQRYFLYTLMNKLSLKLTSASDPVDPGHAEAIACAMAQPQAECGFKPRSENLNYSAVRLRQVFPSRVKTDRFAQELAAAGPPAIGNTIYGGRYGNAEDEGYKYRGRGLIQLTFKGNYKTYGNKAGVDVVTNPDLANDPEVANKLAVAYLASKKINWSDTSFSSLGEQFRKAVGYANQGGKETSRRLGIAKGFYQKIINGELTPLSSLSSPPAQASGDPGFKGSTGIQ